MRRYLKLAISVALVAAALLSVSCGGENKAPKIKAELKSETDSLSYVMGLNVAQNLIKMDSTINVAAVCKAITDYAAGKTILDDEAAKIYYLRYITYVKPEHRRGYEDQYLSDLVKTDRTFTRADNGMAYNVEVIGNEELTPRNLTDLVKVRYTISRLDGEQIFSSYERKDTLTSGLEDLAEGLKSSVKMLGKGGKLKAWMPSKLAYGEAGDEELEIEPYETLYYEIELVDMVRYGARDLDKTTW